MTLVLPLFVALLASFNTAQAGMPTLTMLKAIREASRAYNVQVLDLLRIAKVESDFKPHAKRHNPNGSIDYGLFQINSVHWNGVCRTIDVFTIEGNTHCAAILLAKAKEFRGTDQYWKGRYHSKTPSKKRYYVGLLNKIKINQIQEEVELP